MYTGEFNSISLFQLIVFKVDEKVKVPYANRILHTVSARGEAS